MDHGFDTFYGYLCQRRAHTHYPAYLWDNHQPDLLNNVGGSAHQKVSSVTSDLQEWNSQFNGSDFAHAKILDRAQGFIKKNKENPFFIYYATTIPHAALQAPPEWIEKFPKEWDPKPYLGANGYLPNPRPRATYAAMIAYLDWSVGQLRETLEREGIADRTLIVFTSDNGATFNGGVDTEFFNSNGGLRGKKMSLYEGGIREPFIAWCPSLVPSGKTINEPFVAYDTLASLSELCGTKPPRNDGISYASALLGKEPKKRDYIYVEYPEASAMQAVWIGSFKVIRPDLKKNPEKIEVYDLDSDPSEKTDLAAKRPDLIQRAKQIWTEEHVPSKDFPLGVIDKK
jgi:arylsulfatase A-like enzyme